MVFIIEKTEDQVQLALEPALCSYSILMFCLMLSFYFVYCLRQSPIYFNRNLAQAIT